MEEPLSHTQGTTVVGRHHSLRPACGLAWLSRLGLIKPHLLDPGDAAMLLLKGNSHQYMGARPLPHRDHTHGTLKMRLQQDLCND